MDDEIDILHSELLDGEPEGDAWRYWSLILSRQAVAVYKGLRRLDRRVVNRRMWAEELGMAPGAVTRALLELQRHGFVDLGDTP